jgi:hypothetical protein
MTGMHLVTAKGDRGVDDRRNETGKQRRSSGRGPGTQLQLAAGAPGHVLDDGVAMTVLVGEGQQGVK